MRESIPKPSANAGDGQSAQHYNDKNGPKKHVDGEATFRRSRFAGHKLHKEFKTEIRSKGLLETSAWRDDTAMIQRLWSERSRLVSGCSLTDARMRTAGHFWRRRYPSSSTAAVKHSRGVGPSSSPRRYLPLSI